MRRYAAVLIALAFTWAAQSPALAAEPVRQPTGKWVVDYADTLCSASRVYGTEQSPLTIFFQPSPNGTVIRFVLVRSEKSAPLPEHVTVVTNITKPKSIAALRFSGGDRKSNLWINLVRSDLDRLSAAGEISVRAVGIFEDRFALPKFAAVVKALDTCNANLRKHWNIDGVHKPARSLAPLRRYFSDTDYPREASARGLGGTTGLTMMIDEKGKPKDCLVEETSGVAFLDVMTCAILLERSEFIPATDKAGTKVRSVLNARVHWNSGFN